MMSLPPIILASKSPRRQELLRLMDIPFRVVLHEVDESFPDTLTPEEVALYISEKKASAYSAETHDELVITADTIVVFDNEIIGKPEHLEAAKALLKRLSAQRHTVITAVTIVYQQQRISFADTSYVTFREFTDDEISYYVEKYRPLDKAGSYGIQEWIGVTGIVSMEGSYTNVMGLPTEKLYRYLREITGLAQ